MLIDTHIHVGQYYDQYYSPAFVSDLLNGLNIDFYAVASTTQCIEDYQGVLKEFLELCRLDREKVLPILWVTPYGLEGSIQWYLESDINWRMLKIHPLLNKGVWSKERELFPEVIDIARELRLPLLIHTGDYTCCSADIFEEIIKNNPDITFILAHGRPHSQAIRLAQIYDNVFVDSAFMPVSDMCDFLAFGLDSKLLWGTDMCIPKYFYPDQDMRQYYLNKLESFRKNCSKEQFYNVTSGNAVSLFNL